MTSKTQFYVCHVAHVTWLTHVTPVTWVTSWILHSHVRALAQMASLPLA